jgi:hypothetical protein
MSRTVLFAGGPLHGQTMTVDDGARMVYALEPPEITLDSYGTLDPFCPASRQVAYNVSRFAMCGRIVWVGHLGAEPDEDLAFEVLTSDGAKAASVLA